ncbi:MAG: hypothetical protein QM710_14210 [Flavobacterium sp.]
MDYTENKRFDRIETTYAHLYNNQRGKHGVGNFTFKGFFKCKLVHNNMFSVIVPDLIYVMNDAENFSWFQFYSFLPNHLSKFSDDEIYGDIYIDIAFGHTIKIRFEKIGHIQNFEDNSNLFACEITGPEDLLEYATGKGKLIDGIPYINLFHHTVPEVKTLIEKSASYKGSLWNFQGTKKLQNINYAYFTSLDQIRQDQDLLVIAMASDGVTYLLVDITLEPVAIEVYRESTTNRTATLEQLIDTTIIMNNHIWMHTHDTDGYVYYEIATPFIYRIGITPSSYLPFNENVISRVINVITPDHIVLGDATTKLGLLAPYDEEFTTHIFKIEPFFNSGTNILDFWFDNVNSDLYTGKKIDRPKFDTNE